MFGEFMRAPDHGRWLKRAYGFSGRSATQHTLHNTLIAKLLVIGSDGGHVVEVHVART